MLEGKPGSQSALLTHPKGFVSGRGQDSAGQSSSSTHPCLCGPCFLHWCSVMLEQKWGILKLSKMDLGGQAYNITPLHQTLHLAQCGQTNTVLLKPPNPHFQSHCFRNVCRSSSGFTHLWPWKCRNT